MKIFFVAVENRYAFDMVAVQEILAEIHLDWQAGKAN